MSIRRIITAIIGGAFVLIAHASTASQVDIIGPPGSVGFGSQVAVLPNGNMVITDLYDSSGGSAYLYSADLSLISKVVGINANGKGGFPDTVKIVVLKNGNYLLVNPYWNNQMGMVAWGSKDTGLSGTISAANALTGSIAMTGSAAGDQVGQDGITLLTNGNYVVGSHAWSNNGALTNAGAATWGNGSTGVVGQVSSANSLVGTSNGDGVGLAQNVFALTNGNYVVSSSGWSSSTADHVGATTWGNGATGVKGPISAANSLVGSTAYDGVLNGVKFQALHVTPLANGNYVVANYYWDNGDQVDAGAVTWGNGATGTTGVISPANSLVGSRAGNYVGYPRIIALTNGNYVVMSSDWEGATGINRGAATWASGSGPTSGVVSETNSLIGSQDYQFLGDDPEYIITGGFALTNGNYVIVTPRWSDGVTANLGAVTWGNGSTGLVGVVSAANSLIGARAEDRVGTSMRDAGITALANGNYVVATSRWHNANGVSVGSATWVNGSKASVGVVTPANSLIGSVSDTGVIVKSLSNGNYVVGLGGTATWGNGNTGRVGKISPDISFTGSDAIFPLADGNYVVCSTSWSDGATSSVGAFTWADGSTGAIGAVSPSNSVTGTTASDNVCGGGWDTPPVTALSDGRYVVYSPGWDNEGIVDAEAMTLGVGSVSGHIGPEASVQGSVAFGGDSQNTYLGFDGMFFGGYDAPRQRMAVGRHASNRVTLLTIPPTSGPSLSVGDVSMAEGDAGTQVMTFTINLSQASASMVGFSIGTADASATAGSDYVDSGPTTLSIPAGQTSTTYSVTINGDVTREPNETFTVNLSNASNAVISDAQAIGTITDDEPPLPSLSINNASVTEGNSGTKTLTFTLSLSAPASTAVTYNIATANNTATAGSDYVASSLTGQSIPAGVTSKTFSVTINGDTAIEPNETFFANVSSVVGATVADATGVGTITNDDTPALSINNAAITEGNSGTKTLTFTVSLSAAASTAVTYNIVTANNTATAGSDYVAVPLTAQSIPAGVTSKTFSVTINGDTAIEPNETFYVNVSSVVGATVADPTGVGTIINDDPTPSLSINNASVTEGNSGTKTLTFTVSLSAAASTAVTYNIVTANNTATAGNDYVAVPLTAQSIPAGTTSKPVSVTINGDTAIEPNETFFVNVSSVNGATVADPTGVGTIINDDGTALRVASVSAGGLFDDIDDGNRAPLPSLRDYTLLLHDTAQRICQRAGAATIVAIDDVENRTVLNDLADATNLTCAMQPPYAAVMAPGDSRGFLIAAPTTTDKDGLQVLGRPETFADAHATALSVLPAGQSRPLTVLVASESEGTAQVRVAQAQALARRVQQRVTQDPNENVIVFGTTAMNGLVDLTVRAQPPVNLPKFTSPNDRILVSPALLRQFRGSHVELLPMQAPDEAAQYLQLQQ